VIFKLITTATLTPLVMRPIVGAGLFPQSSLITARLTLSVASAVAISSSDSKQLAVSTYPPVPTIPHVGAVWHGC
jgi:hypothetical protein